MGSHHKLFSSRELLNVPDKGILLRDVLGIPNICLRVMHESIAYKKIAKKTHLEFRRVSILGNGYYNLDIVGRGASLELSFGLNEISFRHNCKHPNKRLD